MRKLRPTFNNFSVKKLELRGPVIGINFGFTNSSVAILEERKAKVLKNDEGSFTTPSVVSFTKNGGGEECLVGAPALRQAVLNSQNTVFNIKRLIGRKFDDKEVQDFIKEFPNKILKSSNGDNVLIEIQGKLYSPQQITSFILIKLKEMTENYLNKKVGDAIITVPNYFDYSQKQALKQAGKLANLRILRFVPDSIAAVFGYRLYCFWRGANKIVAVCNLNGGSFEYTVLELKNYDYEIVLNKYDTCLSGVAFNNVIVNYFVSEFKRENGIDLNKDSIAKQRLREAAEKAKCELSNSAQTEIILPNIIADTNGELKHFQIILSRSKFEELTSELTQRIVEICQQTKEEIKPEVEIRQPSLDNEIISQHWKENLPSTGIDQVLLVGGMTRMPKEIFISQLEGALALGAVYLGVFFGDINYFDDRRTSKNKLIKMASQKMFIGERKFDVQDAANLFWEVIAIFIKEFYSSLHIDIRSRIAITGLGYFAAKYADRKYDIGYCAINQADYMFVEI
ncbi:unnamed protein product [Meloidogyne enterolobii]|uniref:Uncharacterized protein n=1 Tax=Meloidogyne enterolobii TaxID=390850 RepID=A0ACB0ZN64_MELEN